MLGCWSDLGLFVVVGEDASVEVARPKLVVGCLAINRLQLLFSAGGH